MSKVRVLSFGVSMDGYGAGTNQSLDHPLGVPGPDIIGWFHPTRVFQRMYGDGNGEAGVDNDMAELAFADVGAWIMGRNMFGPVHGRRHRVQIRHRRHPLGDRLELTFRPFEIP